jgi:hypothetical protein
MSAPSEQPSRGGVQNAISSAASRLKAAVVGLGDAQWETKIQNFVRDAGLVEVTPSSYYETEKGVGHNYKYFMILKDREPVKSLVYLGPKDGWQALYYENSMQFKFDTDDNSFFDRVSLKLEGTKFVYTDHHNVKYDVRTLYKTNKRFAVALSDWKQPKTTSERVVVAKYSTGYASGTYVVFDNIPPPPTTSTTQNPLAMPTEPKGGRRKSRRVTQSGKRRRRRGTARPRRHCRQITVS